MVRKRWALGALGLLLLAAGAARAEEPRYFAIRNVKVVPVSGPVIENGNVVMANGLIVAVGADVAIPPEAWVIDGKGLTVYPGLIDALTDLGLVTAPARPATPAPGPPAPAPPAAPQAPPRISRGPDDRPGTTPWQNAADELKADDRRIEQWRNAGFTTALAAPKSGIFPGQGAVINLAGSLSDGSDRPGEMVVKTPATLHIALQPVGGVFLGFPGSLMGVISYVKQVFADTAQYAQAQAAYDAQPRGRERPGYDRTVRVIHQAQREQWPVFVPGNTAEQIVRALDLAQQLGVRAVIYGGQQGYDVAAEIAAKKVPILVSLRWPEKDRDADPEVEESLRTLRFRDRAPSTPAALEKAGAVFAFYSDGAPCRGRFRMAAEAAPSRACPKEVLANARKAIQAGLTPQGALRALTLSAAQILGVSDRLGSIEPGKIANLVVADGDLFDEKTKLRMVFVDGRKYEVREAAEEDREEGVRP